jgi:Family of unknown function (DUF5681)
MAKGKYRDGRRGNRPPVKNQFKPGQSGNGKGRPPGKSLISANEIVGRLLREKHPIVLRGRQKMVSFVEIIFMRIFEQACNGNTRALMWAMELIEQIELVETKRIMQPPDMTDLKKKIENMSVEELNAEYRKIMEDRVDIGRKR